MISDKNKKLTQRFKENLMASIKNVQDYKNKQEMAMRREMNKKYNMALLERIKRK